MSEVNLGWRPLKFETVEDLQKQIDLYYLSCYDADGKKIKPYTVTWLANFLDVDRKTLINYERKDDKFFHAIKRAKSKVEEDIEIGALTNQYNATSAIFNLKNNFDWKDKSEVDNNNTWEVTIKWQA